MCLGTFSRRARSLATIFIFARVRILGTQCLFVIATVAKVSRKRGLWLVVRVNTEKNAPPDRPEFSLRTHQTMRLFSL